MAFDCQLRRHYDLLIEKRLKQTNANSLVDKYKHMCVIFNSSGAVLATGYNIFKTNTYNTEHAEEMALRKLASKFASNKRRITINILVVRTNGGISKPCCNCLKKMYYYSSKFTIKWIYYSSQEVFNGITRERFNSMYYNPNKHVSSFYRHKYTLSGKIDNDDDELLTSSDDD